MRHARRTPLLSFGTILAAVALAAACTPSQGQPTTPPAAPPTATASAPASAPPSDPCQPPEAAAAATEADTGLTVIPKPSSTTLLDLDPYRLTDASAIGVVGSDELQAPAQYLADLIQPATGLSLAVATDDAGRDAPIRFCPDPQGKPDSYRIHASADGVWVLAADRGGAFAAVATLRQLLPEQIEATKRADAAWQIPAVEIRDAPRYLYRGFMLDVARSFFPPDDVKRVIDTIALYKINHLHLHLTDDQGWRIAIPDYPKLTQEAASYQSGGKHGGPWFYTTDQFRDIVAYAASRGIAVVPEIDGPGHVNAAQTVYGDLTCDGRRTQPYTGHDVGFSMYCLTDESHQATVRTFLTAAWQEVAGLTDSGYLHVGGDEAMKATPTTYGAYVEIVGDITAKQQQRLYAWHQFGAHPLPKDSVLQYWGTALENRSIGGAESASITEVRAGLKQGATFIMSPADRAYVDQCYDASTPVGTSWAGCITPQAAYDWDPAAYVAPAGGASIIPADAIEGVEATLFSDHVYRGWTDKSESNFLRPVEYFSYMALPRLPALAEVAWTAQTDRSWQDFEPRVTAHEQRWDVMGLLYEDAPGAP